jgi:hypothetical protein
MQPDGTAQEGECVKNSETILTGSGITDIQGEWVFTVPPALCLPVGVVNWVSLVATPSLPYNLEGAFLFPPLQPEYVTTAWSTQGGLTLYVKSWQPNGDPKPEVQFSWHAAVKGLT